MSAPSCANCGRALVTKRAIYDYRTRQMQHFAFTIPADCNPPPERELRPVDDWKDGEFRRRIAWAPVVRFPTFCTNSCAMEFAHAAYRAGYRRKGVAHGKG